MNYSKKPEKLCIFCGERPQSKTREHVLPQWLLKLTGDPKRRAIMGESREGGQRRIRQFAFDQFTFPACAACNNAFSTLEAKVAPIVEGLLDKQPISEEHCDLFLDWMDKVRVGVWLGNRYMSENPFAIDPNFHINARVGTADRMAWLTREDYLDGINMIGSQTPLFAMMPSVFGLRINGLMILSASNDLFLSRQLGLPYASRRWTEIGERRMAIDIAHGTGRLTTPLFPMEPRVPCLRLYQPMFSKFGDVEDRPFDTEYTRRLSLDWEAGRGRVFVDGFSGLKPGGIEALDHLASEGLSDPNRMYKFGASVLEVQNYMLRTGPSLRSLPRPVRHLEAKIWRRAHGINTRLIQAHLEGRVINTQEEIDEVNEGRRISHGS